MIKGLYMVGASAIAGLLSTACATSCPVGSSLKGGVPPNGSAQWCQRPGTSAANTATGAAKNQVLGVHRPQNQGRMLVGPYSDWHANGHLRSHGEFAMRGGRSVANGVWTFWTKDGKRAVEGRYVFGYPAGCFAVWTDRTERLTFAASAGTLVKQKCTPPRSPVATRLAERYRRARLGQAVPERFSAAVGFMLSPSSIPVDSADLAQPKANVQQSLRVAFRRNVGWGKLGIAATVMGTDERRTWNASTGLLGSVSLLPNHKHFDVELSAELGVRMYSVLPRLTADRPASTSERFFTPYTGAQAAGGYRLNEYISIYAALLAQVDLPRTTKSVSKYCDPFSCVGMESEWDIGGSFLGAMIQVRFLVR